MRPPHQGLENTTKTAGVVMKKKEIIRELRCSHNCALLLGLGLLFFDVEGWRVGVPDVGIFELSGPVQRFAVVEAAP